MSSLDENTQNAGTEVPGEVAAIESATTGAQTAAPADDIETRARAQGWVPKEEFRGPEDKWRDAEAFVKHGEENLPILRERTKTLASKLAETEARLARKEQEDQEKWARLEKMTTTALQRQRDQLVGQYEAAKLNAVQSADTDRYAQLDRDQRQAVAQFDTQAAEAQQPPQQRQVQSPYSPENQAKIAGWAAQNPWYTNDPEMHAVANHFSQRRASEVPGITLEQNLVETERYMRQRYPEKFPASQRANAGGPAVEGGGRMSASSTRGKGFADLPSDAKAQFAKFVKDGIYTEKEAGDYAKEYFAL